MEGLKILEQKVALLIGLFKDTKELSKQLQDEKLILEVENQELKAENARIVEENAQLLAQIDAFAQEFSKDRDNVSELKEERKLTKVVVDDLIKSIDSLVER